MWADRLKAPKSTPVPKCRDEQTIPTSTTTGKQICGRKTGEKENLYGLCTMKTMNWRGKGRDESVPTNNLM